MSENDAPIHGSVPESDTLDNSDHVGRISLACDPRRWLHRYLILGFICFLSFGHYYCYDSPGALQDVIKRDMELTTSQYMLFYSLYSWPNVILCFFGGLLIDKVFGLCWGAIIFSVIVTLGQLLFASGALFNAVWLMYIGRFVFGFGGESLAVAQNAYSVNWFEGRALNMVFGLQLSFSRIGSTIGMVSLNPIYNAIDSSASTHGNKCLGITLLIGACFCIFSLFNAFILGYFNKRADRILNKHNNNVNDGDVPLLNDGDDGKFRLSDLKQFTLSFWLLCGICVAYYIAVFLFISLGLVFYQNKYEMAHDEATLINSLVYIIAACASPVFGFCIDRVGRNIVWIFLGVFVTLCCHVTIAFTFIPPYYPVVLIGLSYSILASALWPIVSMVVTKQLIGTAYGIMQSIQNLGLALATILAGVIVDSYGYIMLEIFFQLCLCAALLFTIILYIIDRTRGGRINLSARVRRLQFSAVESQDVD
ncbi:hypothetical protein HELRODRAFT_115505 [Helobdella robusta]|uniref:Lysosomal dipeptide transporter MFSD1 n=1 Tax=Helobdella robusta TaxID=6412 RepID=T1EG88_HELRO|nr:hypothetical protein HELRODRAFT_115505 [Helobdella robusta]ESN93636.1 hypothetical protein HELRODRAFT_115505 [Helobdella robusta]